MNFSDLQTRLVLINWGWRSCIMCCRKQLTSVLWQLILLCLIWRTQTMTIFKHSFCSCKQYKWVCFCRCMNIKVGGPNDLSFVWSINQTFWEKDAFSASSTRSCDHTVIWCIPHKSMYLRYIYTINNINALSKPCIQNFQNRPICHVCPRQLQRHFPMPTHSLPKPYSQIPRFPQPISLNQSWISALCSWMTDRYPWEYLSRWYLGGAYSYH